MRQDAMINGSHTLPFQPFNGDADHKLSGNKHPRKCSYLPAKSANIMEMKLMQNPVER